MYMELMYTAAHLYTRVLYRLAPGVTFPGMTDRELLRLAMLNAPSLARMAGVSVYTVREMIAGRREGNPETRAALAKALREHSDTLGTIADQLERGE